MKSASTHTALLSRSRITRSWGVQTLHLSAGAAEIRSLVVDESVRSQGIGAGLVDSLITRARGDGFQKLCAFTHAPRYFLELGFSVVPHAWLPEKIHADCGSCPQFRRCGQYAVVQTLARAEARVGRVFRPKTEVTNPSMDKSARSRELVHG